MNLEVDDIVIPRRQYPGLHGLGTVVGDTAAAAIYGVLGWGFLGSQPVSTTGINEVWWP